MGCTQDTIVEKNKSDFLSIESMQTKSKDSNLYFNEYKNFFQSQYSLQEVQKKHQK